MVKPREDRDPARVVERVHDLEVDRPLLVRRAEDVGGVACELGGDAEVGDDLIEVIDAPKHVELRRGGHMERVPVSENQERGERGAERHEGTRES